MMKLMITGLTGTLAPKLEAVARRAGHDVIGWDHRRIAPQDAAAGAALLHAARPDAIAHLALGPVEWAAQLAAHARAEGMAFLFTSSAMVFDHEPDGPHRPQDERSARDDYGRYKMACEDAVLQMHPGACVARLGWQIDGDGRGNNMLAQLDRQQAKDGRIGASRLWRPACSFMDDTAEALRGLLLRRERGVFHLDSNATAGHTFDRIVLALAARFERSEWNVDVNGHYAHDQRLAGHEALLPSLASRLSALRDAPAR
jgi:dTDP-4-dehydrorhamnose reductase